ncbi:unnamed protein product [Camellia sinensis]
MVRRGVGPNAVTYGALLDGFFWRGQMDKAIEVFHSTVDKGIEPSTIGYTILINGYCKNMKIEEAMNLFREIPCKRLELTIHNYNVMLQGLFGVGRCSTTQGLLNEMKAQDFAKMGSSRSQRIYLVDLVNKGLLGEAKELLMTMEETGCLPNCATYNVMVCGFLKANDYSEANILVEKMIGRGFSVDASTLATIMDLLSAKGQDPTLFQMIKKLVPQDNIEGIYF